MDGAVARMVLLGLTDAYYTTFASVILRWGQDRVNATARFAI